MVKQKNVNSRYLLDKEICQILGLDYIPGSGNGEIKGEGDDLLRKLQAKFTGEQQLTVKHQDLRQLRAQAQGRPFSLFVMGFEQPNGISLPDRWVAMPVDQFTMLWNVWLKIFLADDDEE